MEKSILMRLVFRLYKLIRFGFCHLIKKMKDVLKASFMFAIPFPPPVCEELPTKHRQPWQPRYTETETQPGARARQKTENQTCR